MVELQLPWVLRSDDGVATNAAVETLHCYYGRGPHTGHRFTGSRFDTWDSTGLRDASVNRFTADDLVAVSLLSIEVSGEAAIRLLVDQAADFSTLLEELGPDRDLADEQQTWGHDWAGWRLHRKLDDLPEVGPTTASKLLARKRPRLRPIYDSKVSKVIGSENIWEPLRATLSERSGLQQRLLELRSEAGLGEAVSAIRVFDVLAWMQGAHKGCERVPRRR
jgi:hypothetical protein